MKTKAFGVQFLVHFFILSVISYILYREKIAVNFFILCLISLALEFQDILPSCYLLQHLILLWMVMMVKKKQESIFEIMKTPWQDKIAFWMRLNGLKKFFRSFLCVSLHEDNHYECHWSESLRLFLMFINVMMILLISSLISPM